MWVMLEQVLEDFTITFLYHRVHVSFLLFWWCQFNVQTQQQLVLCYVQCQQSQNRVENTEYLLCADGDFYFVSDISMTQVSKEEELERAIKSSRIDQES